MKARKSKITESKLLESFKKEFSDYLDFISPTMKRIERNPMPYIPELMWMAYAHGYMKAGKGIKIGY